MTNRLFTMATTPNRLIGWLRPRLAPAILGFVVRSRLFRRAGFRTVSQIALSYRGRSLASSPGQISWRGLRAGDRLPDTTVTDAEGHRINLRESLVTPNYLLAGVNVHSEDEWPSGVDAVITILPGEASAWLLIRPDGYIAGIWRTAAGAREYLRRWSAKAR